MPLRDAGPDEQADAGLSHTGGTGIGCGEALETTPEVKEQEAAMTLFDNLLTAAIRVLAAVGDALDAVWRE
ncbi:MAG: hypothetical protein KGL39_25655 [Patescibacteria group bacterium]|nr:hypothetical protein [Patescibacteria group bacterium]